MASLEPRLVLLTNIPTPYRTAFLNVLREVLAERGLGLHVLFCARSEPDRSWPFDPGALHFPFTFLDGLHPELGGAKPHVNPSVVGALAHLRPQWLLAAGAWNTPTVLMASQLPRSVVGHRLFWSEGHADAVLHASGLVAKLRQRALRAWDGFAVPNERSGEWASEQVGRRVPTLLLPNTVDEGFFTPAGPEERSALRERFGWSGSRVLFTALRLEGFKGLPELLRGWQLLPEPLRRSARLAIAGEGSLRGDLARAAEGGSGIEALGPLTPAGVRDRLRAADGFILPSHRDPNPLSPIEAALCGRPLLLSHRAGNVAELVVERRTGFVIEPIEASAVARAMEQLLTSPGPLREAMGTAARERALSTFTRKAVAERFVEGLLERFPGGPTWKA